MEQEEKVKKLAHNINEKIIQKYNLQKIYIGKTDDFKQTCFENGKRDHTYTLELDCKTPDEIASMEELLIEELKRNCHIKIEKIPDNILDNSVTHTLYITFSAHIEADELCEYDEKIFFGK